jgi:hypothetical protein
VIGEASDDKRLEIYLNDHLAGSIVGVELVQRIAGSNRGTPLGNLLEGLTVELREDRETLERLMDQLGAGRDRVKATGAWAAEKVGRLKLNGQLRGYSPLSRLEELESLRVGIRGKLDMWRALSNALGEVPGFDFDELAARAERQLGRLDEHHLKAAESALAGAPVTRRD